MMKYKYDSDYCLLDFKYKDTLTTDNNCALVKEQLSELNQ